MSIEDVEKNLQETARLLKAFSNDRRLLIACVLHRGERCVGELEEIVGLSQSALSQHLSRLRRDGLVKTRRDAQTIYYSMENNSLANELVEFLCELNCPEARAKKTAEAAAKLND